MWLNFFPNLWYIIAQNGSFLLSALWSTLAITFAGFAVALVLGTVLALLRTNSSNNALARVGRGFSKGYVLTFRGLPDLVVLLLLFSVFLVAFNRVPMFIAIIGFGLTFGAYIAETIRAAILSIDANQSEAARDLGTTRMGAMRRVILPQAFRRAIPQLGNELITLAKGTVVVGFITVIDLTSAINMIVARTFYAAAGYILLAIMYIIIVFALTLIIKFFEVKVFRQKRQVA